MIPAPAIALPIVTHNRFQPRPARLTVAGCSVISAEVHIARQTSQLHRIARATSSSAGAFILAAATLTISGLLPARPRSAGPPPPATNNAARIVQPSKLPAQ